MVGRQPVRVCNVLVTRCYREMLVRHVYIGDENPGQEAAEVTHAYYIQ